MEEKKIKKTTDVEKLKKIDKKVDPQKQQEQEKLLFEADAISPARKKINQLEVVYLRNGVPINLSAYVCENYVPHSVHFFKPFFYAIADLFFLDRSVMDTYIKPQCVPRFINRYVYGRFPNKVLRRIHEKNPLMSDFGRPYKNFQFLTLYADNLLRVYIEDAIRVLEASKSFDDFKIRFLKEFGVPNQMELFDY